MLRDNTKTETTPLLDHPQSSSNNSCIYATVCVIGTAVMLGFVILLMFESVIPATETLQKIVIGSVLIWMICFLSCVDVYTGCGRPNPYIEPGVA
jgi:hypothetical protein